MEKPEVTVSEDLPDEWFDNTNPDTCICGHFELPAVWHRDFCPNRLTSK